MATRTPDPRPSTAGARLKWRVAVIANIKVEGQSLPAGVPADAFADFDHIETIDDIRAAVESDGHKTTFLPADATLPRTLLKYKPDIVFNMAEGLGGDAREAHAPALLEMLKIPYRLAVPDNLDKT
jgi:D-alanine-D-alanine ligase